MATRTQTVDPVDVKRTFAAQFESKDLVTFDAGKHYGDWRDEFHQMAASSLRMSSARSVLSTIARSKSNG